MQHFYLLTLMACLSLCCSSTEKKSQTEALSFSQQFHSQQAVIVIMPDDTHIQGELLLTSFKNGKWEKDLPAFPITVGRTGLAWGKGKHPEDWQVGALKKEGDGKAPQGIFDITGLFGYAAPHALRFQPDLPYLQCLPTTFCVDDVNSQYYNQIVDTRKVTKDWKSAENMLRNDNLYSLGAIVAYNTSPVVSGEGSCVFVHIWRANDKPTAGCTAMDEKKIQHVFPLLKASAHPVLVQMTRAAWDKHMSKYDIYQ